MKKITMRRRMISLTLAASVALPQASSAFAASLWDEDGVSHKVAQAIESGQPAPETTTMPWVTLPTDDKSEQSTPTPEMPSMATETPWVTPTDGEAQSSPSDWTELTTPTDGVDRITPTGGESSSTPTEGVDKTPPTDGGLIIIPDYETTPSDKNGEESELPPPAESVTPATDPDQEIDSDDGNGPTDPDNHLPGDENSAGETTPVPAPSGLPDEGEEHPSDEEKENGLTTSEIIGGEEVTNSAMGDGEVLPEELDGASDDMPFSMDLGPLTQAMYYRLGYGVPINGSRYKAVDALGGHFAVESTEGGDTGNPTYGYRDYGYNLTDKTSLTKLKTANPNFNSEAQMLNWRPYTLCIFPTEEQLGRVPDQQFAGWYVYPSGAKANQSASDAMNWVYGDVEHAHVEGEMSPVVTYDYESGDPHYNEKYPEGERRNVPFYDLGDTWDGGRDYGYGYAVLRDNNGNLRYEVVYDEMWDRTSWYVTKGDGATNPVSFVARWEASDESRADKATLSATVNGAAQELELYSSGSYTNKTQFVPGESGGSYEFWVRVDADVDSISLNLNTKELYYNDYVGTGDDYDSYQLDREKSHVAVSATFGGSTTTYTNDLSAQMLPKWETGISAGGNQFIIPQNSLNAGERAHSEWSVTNITLRNATGNDLYNDIVVTVESPSGDETTTYTFHVQRLSEPTLIRSWGNTPVGMVRRDDHYLSTTEAATAAEKYFDEHRTFDFGNRQYPNGNSNHDGTIFRNVYSTNAWLTSTGDVDKDPTAIVVYQDSSFRDPGVSIIGTIGENVNLTKGILSRSLKLKQAKGGLFPDLIGSTGTDVTDCWYKDGKLVDSEVWETVSDADGTDLMDLRGLNILPGVYTLEYRYTDPISGNVYGSDANDYVTEAGKASAPAFKRTVVVLPTPGDVDMDGAVTMADAIALENILGTARAGSASYTTLNGKALMDDNTGEIMATDPSLTLFAFRVCDMNYDGRLDSKDIELLENLPNPKTTNEIN
ncbi:MAG: hypothetical protein K2F83_02570, partial [Oscillospiraceae bacterium]|nr:hypothetical protein [Oscillospiraceae bacterium]